MKSSVVRCTETYVLMPWRWVRWGVSKSYVTLDDGTEWQVVRTKHREGTGFQWRDVWSLKPVCSTCNDTHRMDLHDFTEGSRKVMCTYCPIPCDKCRGGGGRGAYCATTPCPCDCHKK